MPNFSTVYKWSITNKDGFKDKAMKVRSDYKLKRRREIRALESSQPSIPTRNINSFLIEASKYYSITKSGELERCSIYGVSAKTGVGFDSMNKRGYMTFSHSNIEGVSKNILSHRMVFYLANSFLPDQIDHINRVRNDNKPCNLRPATQTQNNANVTSQKGSSSKYLGVKKMHKPNRWTAAIKVDKISTHLGTFHNEKDAAQAYNKAANDTHGEFANLNIIE